MSQLHTEMREKLSKRFIASIASLMEQKIIRKSTHSDGFSFGDLAVLLYGEGSSQTIISNILKGTRLVNYAEAIILCQEFGIDLTWMMTGEGVVLTNPTPGPSK